uniref:Carboxylic ester hydrolase n=1 Tax=Electrophorus electricus TaxID=8005 RepID=A0A4W4HC25_ELEEL
MGRVALILCSLIGANLIPARGNDGPVVQTKLGALKGAYSTAKGKHTVIYSYLGVPFAKPPVGPLRLAPPQPTEAWDGVRDATKQPYMCIQNMQETMSIFGNLSISVEFPEVSEDCLYLNIYTPAKPSEYANLPVLVWIHGGGFSLGSASIFDGSVLSAYENVVVVLIQYRLGLLGFFSTGDEHAPGNYGLLDQVAALQWVQENIHSFGGDSGSVTIFGESAGGISVSLLLLSPLSAGLFHRAIAESGCALMQGIVKDPLPVAQQAANMSGCDTSSTKMIAECARNWSTEHVLKFSTELMMLQFAVTEDKNFLPKPVEELLHNQEFSKVPLITGVNNDEFGWLLPNYFAPPGWVDGMDREQLTSLIGAFSSDLASQLLVDEYLGSSVDRIKVRDTYKEIMGDIVFTIPALTVAKLHKAAGVPVYLYEFQHPPSLLQASRPSFVKSDHADELLFIFGSCFGNSHMKFSAPCTEEEKELCRAMMAYWGNFARTGSPNGPGLTIWPEHGAETEYLAIGLKQKPGKNLKAKRYLFMTEKLPELMRSAQEKQEHTEL